MKRFFSVFLSLILVAATFLCVPITAAFAEEPVFDVITEEIIEFPCGLTSTAYFDKSSNTLTVKGTGVMNFFYDDVPWFAYRNEIYNVVVEEGITVIPDIAFLDCDIKKIKLPASLEVIGTDALSMTDIEEIDIPENSKLRSFMLTSYFRNVEWYKNHPNGPVYLGNMLLA